MFKKAFWRFIFSYFVIFFIPLIVGVVAYFNVKNVMLESLYRYNKTTLTQLKDKMENEVMKPVESLADWINLSPYYFIFLPEASETLDNSDKLLNIRNLCREISSQTYKNSYILDAFIYIHSENMLVGPSYNTNPFNYYTYVNRPLNLDYDRWIKLLNGDYQMKYIPSFEIKSDYKKLQTILFANTLTKWNIDGKYANVFVIIDQSKITELMKEIVSYPKGIIWILDKDNNQVLKVSSNEKSDIALPKLDFSIFNSFDFKQLNIKGQRWIVYYVVSPTYGWRYISMVPIDSFFEDIRRIRNLSLLLMLLMSIVGSVLIFFFSLQNYRPLSEIKSILSSRYLPQDQEENKNEYTLIRELIQISLSKEDELKNQISRFTPILKNNILLSLLTGNRNSKELENVDLKALGIEIIGDSFIVLTIEVDDCSGFIKDETEQEYALTTFVISNVLNELLTTNNIKFWQVIISRTKIGLILNFASEETIDMHKLTELSNTMIDFLEKNFSIYVSVGISSLHKGIANIKKAFEQAEKALNLKITKSNMKVFSYVELSCDLLQEERRFLPKDMENKLLNAIKDGSEEEVNKICNEIFEYIKNLNSPHLAKIIFIYLYGVYFQVLNTYPQDLKHEIKLEPEEIMKLIVEEKSSKKIFSRVRSDFLTLTRNIILTKQKSGNDLIGSILEIVEREFSSPDISLLAISEKFGITPQYLSTIFKEKTGQNLSEYILGLRMNKAKELLLTTNYPVNQIAKLIGYTEVSGFTKAFKKFEGVSPNKFRELNQN